jgi:hypothetical protein
MKKSSALLMLPIILLLTTLAFAHGDMEHVLGTVVQVTDHTLSVKTKDGSTKVVAFDHETHFLKGTSPATIADVVVGARVVIHAHNHGTMLHAAEVKIGTNALNH